MRRTITIDVAPARTTWQHPVPSRAAQQAVARTARCSPSLLQQHQRICVYTPQSPTSHPPQACTSSTHSASSPLTLPGCLRCAVSCATHPGTTDTINSQDIHISLSCLKPSDWPEGLAWPPTSDVQLGYDLSPADSACPDVPMTTNFVPQAVAASSYNPSISVTGGTSTYCSTDNEVICRLFTVPTVSHGLCIDLL